MFILLLYKYLPKIFIVKPINNCITTFISVKSTFQILYFQTYSFFVNVQDIEFIMVNCNLRTKEKFKLLIFILRRTLTVLNTKDFNKCFVIIQ